MMRALRKRRALRFNLLLVPHKRIFTPIPNANTNTILLTWYTCTLWFRFLFSYIKNHIAMYVWHVNSMDFLGINLFQFLHCISLPSHPYALLFAKFFIMKTSNETPNKEYLVGPCQDDTNHISSTFTTWEEAKKYLNQFITQQQMSISFFKDEQLVKIYTFQQRVAFN
jgi:hypothetical protein